MVVKFGNRSRRLFSSGLPGYTFTMLCRVLLLLLLSLASAAAACFHRLLSVGKRPGQDFFEQLAAKLDEYSVAVPTVQIEYRNLTVRTEAMVGSAGIPTAGNFAPKLVQVCEGGGDLEGLHEWLRGMML